ncbi:MAG: zinc ribbon domain-containing protein, partial [Anaerotardibacter sp.]
MELKEAIAAVRKEAGLTQEEMARKLYVTRQAISRWENGETTPGIDMVKLICVTFNVPIDKFLDMPAPNLCQCCGMSLTSELYGTLSNGTSTADYCKWCYEEGAFTSPDMNMDEFIERTAPMTAEAMGVSLDEAVSFMATLLPTLKRWKEVEDNEKKYGKELREKYGDEVIDAANEKYRSRS